MRLPPFWAVQLLAPAPDGIFTDSQFNQPFPDRCCTRQDGGIKFRFCQQLFQAAWPGRIVINADIIKNQAETRAEMRAKARASG